MSGWRSRRILSHKELGFPRPEAVAAIEAALLQVFHQLAGFRLAHWALHGYLYGDSDLRSAAIDE
jgi:hypothetical protein